MPIPMTQYLAEAEQRDRALTGLETCAGCGVFLQETTTGYRRTEDGAKCSDCYFDALSDLVDKHPIGRPKAVRGSAV